MIKCAIIVCTIAASGPPVCQPPMQIQPADAHPITSPMECMRGAAVYSTQQRMQDNPDTPTTRGNREQLVDGKPAPGTTFFVMKTWLEGDGSDIIRTWLAEQKRQREATAPQIK
jgi:hypothetical protein